MENLKKIIIFNLVIIFCLTAFLKVKANTAANTTLNLGIGSGSLGVTAPASASFVSKNFSYLPQNSSDNLIGDITAEDNRGNGRVWNVNITASNWTTSSNTMAYNGDGSATGQLTLKAADTTVTSLAGAGTAGITKGNNAPFTKTTTVLKLVSGTVANGGRYQISGLKASQFIPANICGQLYHHHGTHHQLTRIQTERKTTPPPIFRVVFLWAKTAA